MDIELEMAFIVAQYCKVGNIHDLLMEREFNTPWITAKLYCAYCKC